ncbi:RNA polymerase sigma factor [Butyricimonas virosa]|nr:sigma factor-like helix-turn-helix DNA-binding protein [Butyricimonas virosa]
MEGYSWDEIAEKFGVSVNTEKTHKSRGFRSLRSKFQDSVCLFLI